MTKRLILFATLLASCSASNSQATLTQIGISNAGDVAAWHDEAARSGQPNFAGEGCAVSLTTSALSQIEAAIARSAPVGHLAQKDISHSPVRIHLSKGGTLIFAGGGIAVDAQGRGRQMSAEDRKLVGQLVFAATEPYHCGPLESEPL